MFEIRDPNGWTGVEAETIEEARFACETIAQEGYDLPLEIVAPDSDFPIEKLVSWDASFRPVWQTSYLARRFEGRRYAA